jgi:exopolysaccharide biosynthesis polyprenyl glycosylphosphotransferase
MIVDVFCLLISYTLASFLRYGNLAFMSNPFYQRICVILAIASIITGLLFESYHNILRRGYYQEFKAVFKHMCVTVAIVLAYVFLAKTSQEYARSVYVGSFVMACVIMYGMHLILKGIVRKNMAKSSEKERVLVIVNGADADEFIGKLLLKDYAEYQLCGCILYNRKRKDEEVLGVPIVGAFRDTVQYVRDNVIDAVLIQPNKVDEGLKRTIRAIVDMGITVYIEVTKTYGDFPNMRATAFGGCRVITISIHKVRLRQLFIKRSMDILGSAVGLVFTAITFIILAPIIKTKSPGPIFFSQVRVGKNGRQFKLYKFRSMYVDAEARKQELMQNNKMQGQMFKMDDDPRITPIGHFIRRHSIDEFPQFWNVLKGNMSLVGTRPPTVDEVKKYELHHRIRLSIKPGITGLWQVSGRSDIINFEDVVKLDEKYIREWNLGLDAKIICQTALVVFGRKGST